MTHRRRLIRDAAVLRLTGLALTGSRVYGSRARVLTDAQLPALRVYTPQERVDTGSELLGDSMKAHRVELRVEAVAKAADTVENTIDAICEAVEAAIATDETLGGVTQWCAYQGTDIEYEDEDQTVMQATLSFETVYIQE